MSDSNSKSTQIEQQERGAEQPVLAPATSAPEGPQSSTSSATHAPAIATSAAHEPTRNPAKGRKALKRPKPATVPLMSTTGPFHVALPSSISNSVEKAPATESLPSRIVGAQVVEPAIQPMATTRPQESRWRPVRDCCGCCKPEDST